MDQEIAAKMNQGIRKVQALWSESIQIGVNNPVMLAALLGIESLQQKFTNTGMIEVIRMPASIAQPDLQAAPVIGARVSARGRLWSVYEVDPTQTTWELILESPKK